MVSWDRSIKFWGLELSKTPKSSRHVPRPRPRAVHKPVFERSPIGETTRWNHLHIGKVS